MPRDSSLNASDRFEAYILVNQEWDKVDYFRSTILLFPRFLQQTLLIMLKKILFLI